MLQCGHGEFAVENLISSTALCHSSSASMRPRRIRRGEPGCPNDPDADCCWLQCGHGEFAVENLLLPCIAFAQSIRLQCGHGEFAVENEAVHRIAVPTRWWLQCGHGEFAVEND